MDRIAEMTALVRTIERGSQAAAAREMGVTPAMVGRYIKSLEDRLGARMLNRTTATQGLTEAGTLFYARASAMLGDLAAAEAAVSDGQAAPAGTLRISLPAVFGARYAASALARFGAAHPGLTIDLTLSDRRVDLVVEGYDLALRIGQLEDSTLIARRLAPCRMMAVAAPSYLARFGEPMAPADLRRHECLLYAYASRGRVWRFLGPEGRTEVEVGGRWRANNGEALNEAAIAGAGIVLQPSFIAGDALRDGRLRRVLAGWQLEEFALYAVIPSALHVSPKVRLCIAFLAECFGKVQPWDDGLA